MLDQRKKKNVVLDLAKFVDLDALSRDSGFNALAQSAGTDFSSAWLRD